MFHLNESPRCRSLIVGLFALIFMASQPQAKAQDTSPGIDFFSGINFSFADMNFYRQYDVYSILLLGSSGTWGTIGN